MDTKRVYEVYYKLLIDNDESPYRRFSKDGTPISLDEFLWAFTTVGARHIVFNNQETVWTENKSQVYMILPLVDMINHSQ